MLDILVYAVALLYFCWMSHCVSQACLLYRVRHLGQKAGFAGLIVWALLAVFPTFVWLYFWS